VGSRVNARVEHLSWLSKTIAYNEKQTDQYYSS